jgi:hypothetical protein
VLASHNQEYGVSNMRTCRGGISLFLFVLGWFLLSASQDSAAQDRLTQPTVAQAEIEGIAQRAAERDLFLAPYRELAAEWKEDVARISASNRTDGSAEHILFLGSSSFRLWETIESDMAPHRVVRRAFGGAKYRDLAIYAPQCVQGLCFSQAMIFIANDIRGKEDDNTPETVQRFANLAIDAVRAEQPRAKIFLVAVTPSSSRFEHWPKIQQINRVLKTIAMERSNTFYIATARVFLDADGFPRDELFQKDRLHLNAAGYRLWAERLNSALEDAK